MNTRVAGLLFLAACASTLRADVNAVVEVEELVTTYTAANNGAGPTWCYGSTIVARLGDDVFASVIETGKDVPPLCNTRWQLWHRSAAGWKLAQYEHEYRQREPCPIAVFHSGQIFLSVNPSIHPPAVKYGPCRPLVLAFDSKAPAAPARTLEPAWAEGTDFTDHSYRGFAADGAAGELLLLNIHGKTGVQFVSWRDGKGVWHARSTIEFPIRSCYPQVALRGRAAHVLAIGDIVEPVEEWRKLKFEKTGSNWDYVFRRLFYTYTPDIAKTPFAAPIEVDTVEKTGGAISNLDLHIDDAGAAHLLYLKRPHQHAFLRDKYFPGQPMTTHLEHVVVKEGKVVSRRTLLESPRDDKVLSPAFARFHIGPRDAMYVLVGGTGPAEEGKSAYDNFIAPLDAGSDRPSFTRLKMEHPFRTFFTNTPRGGSKPSEIIDLFGTGADSLALRYARVRLRP